MSTRHSIHSSSLPAAATLIIGGSSGIGLAVAERMLAAGSAVTLVARNEERLRESADGLRNMYNAKDIHWRRGDACDEGDMQSVIDFAITAMGQLDAVIVVAGDADIGPLITMKKTAFEHSVLGGVLPGFLALRHAAPRMLESGGGAFVVVSSVAAVMPAALMGAYAAGKSALDAMVRAAAVELGPLGIRVNAVRPGFTHTAATSQTCQRSSQVDAYIAEQALRRVGEPLDIAAAICFLAGPQAAWITGQILNIDGGLSLQRIPRRLGSEWGALAIPEAWQPYLD